MRSSDTTLEVESSACPLCEGTAAEFVMAGGDRLHQRPGRFQVVKCTGCGLMRTDPRPTAGSMGDYYPVDYGPYLQTAVSPSGWLRETLRRLADPFDTATPRVVPGHMLEIGTASGNFALEMRRRGWRVTGIELDPTSARRAQVRLESAVLCGDVLDMSLEAGQYDLICAWMTLEHLRNPVLALKKCHDWLRPGGWLAFSVPDCGGWQFRMFREDWFATQLPTHLYHFTPPLLRDMLDSCGYDNVAIRWQRTLFDVLMSVAYLVENRGGERLGRAARALARSLAGRVTARGLGLLAAPFRLTGRLTVWAQKQEAEHR